MSILKDAGLDQIPGKEIDRSRFHRRLVKDDGSEQLIIARSPIFTLDGEDIDTDLALVRGSYQPKIADYRCEIDPAVPKFRYKGRTGEVEVAYRGGAPTSVAVDRAMVRYLYPNHEIRIVCTPAAVKTVRVLENARAPKSYAWGVISEGLDIRPHVVGRDADGNKCEVSAVYENGVYTDTWTGRVSRRVDKRTRRRQWFDNPKYPVAIDPLVTETPGETIEDDVYSFELYGTSFSLISTGVSLLVGHFSSGDTRIGLRYTTVAIPQGATITSAAVMMYCRGAHGGGGAGSGGTIFIWADDVDTAAAWSASNAPRDVTKTTASGSTATFAADDLFSIDVTDVIQEIVNRGGWSSGNNMRFVMSMTATGSYDAAGFCAEEWFTEGTPAPGQIPPLLSINYTTSPASSGAANLLEGLVR